MKVYSALAIAWVTLAASSAGFAAADEVTTARFVRDCRSSVEDCKLMVDEVAMDSDASCAPSVDQVVVEIGRHSDWSGRPWSESVQSAIEAICKH
jgi:hypothetical protein